MPVNVNVPGARNIVIEGDYYVTLTNNNGRGSYDGFNVDYVQFLHGRKVKLVSIEKSSRGGLLCLQVDFSDQVPPDWSLRTNEEAHEAADLPGWQDSPNTFGYLEHDLVKRIVWKARAIEHYREEPDAFDFDPALEPLYP